MEKFLEFSGFFLAHAVGSVSEGGMLIAFAATSDGQDKRNLVRFVDEQAYENSAAQAQAHIDTAIASMAVAAACIDGYYTFDDGQKTDAIHLFAKWNDGGQIREMMMSLPYQPLTDSQPFRVFKPKLRNFTNLDQSAIQQNFDWFWNGVDSHGDGAAAWNAALDQSK